MITSNGARVHDSDGQQIFAHNLDRDIAADLFEIVRNDPKIVTNVYREDEWYMNRHRPEEMRFFKEAVFNYKLYEPGELDPQGISKVFFTCEDHEHLLPLEQAMNARWGDRVNVSFSTLTCRKSWRVGYRRACAGGGGEDARLHSFRLHRLRRRYERR
nr:HMP-PP phosphatase [Klebsiella pneumoniae]